RVIIGVRIENFSISVHIYREPVHFLSLFESGKCFFYKIFHLIRRFFYLLFLSERFIFDGIFQLVFLNRVFLLFLSFLFAVHRLYFLKNIVFDELFPLIILLLLGCRRFFKLWFKGQR